MIVYMNPTFEDALNQFYKLKNQYESSYFEKYVKPIVKNKALTKREKKQMFASLPKRPCVNCKRPVTTIFSVKFIDDDPARRELRVSCGDSADPCLLNIRIDCGQRVSLTHEIRDGMKQIEQLKLDIIKDKNDLLFFGDAPQFDEHTEDLKFEADITGTLIETNILRNENPTKQAKTLHTIQEFERDNVLGFKKQMKVYQQTNNPLVLNQAVASYVHEIVPSAVDIRRMKYAASFVEISETTPERKLVQLIKTVENDELFYAEDDVIHKMSVGEVQAPVAATNKSKKPRQPKSDKNPSEVPPKAPKPRQPKTLKAAPAPVPTDEPTDAAIPMPAKPKTLKKRKVPAIPLVLVDEDEDAEFI